MSLTVTFCINRKRLSQMTSIRSICQPIISPNRPILTRVGTQPPLWGPVWIYHNPSWSSQVLLDPLKLQKQRSRSTYQTSWTTLRSSFGRIRRKKERRCVRLKTCQTKASHAKGTNHLWYKLSNRARPFVIRWKWIIWVSSRGCQLLAMPTIQITR